MARLPAMFLIPTLAFGPSAALATEPCVARDPVTAEINAREGIRLAKAENFEAAEALFLTATRLDPCMPKYPYLLGRAHERQGEFDAAEAAYQTVIDRFPTSVEFTKAQGALIELRARRPSREAEQAAEAAREAEERRRADELAKAREDAAKAREAARLARAEAKRAREAEEARIRAEQAGAPWGTVGWLTAGVGLAAVAIGAGFSLAAQDADDELALAATRPDRARYDDLVDDRETFSTLGWAGYGVGAALMLGGLTLVLLDDGPAPAVIPTEGGAVMGVSGRF